MKTNHWLTGLVGLSLLGMLYTQAAADQLYIRNRPYKGTVKRADGRLWVDLKTFAAALGATVEQNSEGGTLVKMPDGPAPENPVAAGKLMVANQEVESQQENGAVLVPLEATAKLLGAKVISNKQMGTIDVSLAASQAPIATTAVGAKPVAAGPIIRAINKNGSAVEVTSQLVPGRTNVVEFGAEW